MKHTRRAAPFSTHPRFAPSHAAKPFPRAAPFSTRVPLPASTAPIRLGFPDLATRLETLTTSIPIQIPRSSPSPQQHVLPALPLHNFPHAHHSDLSLPAIVHVGRRRPTGARSQLAARSQPTAAKSDRRRPMGAGAYDSTRVAPLENMRALATSRGHCRCSFSAIDLLGSRPRRSSNPLSATFHAFDVVLQTSPIVDCACGLIRFVCLWWALFLR